MSHISQEAANRMLLDAASRLYPVGIIKALEEGADVNAQNDKGETALHLAFLAYANSSVKQPKLLDNTVQAIARHPGCNVNIPNQLGFTPLHLAAEHYDSKSVAIEHLLCNKPDKTSMDYESGLTPFDLAQIYRKPESIQKKLLPDDRKWTERVQQPTNEGWCVLL